MNSKIKMRRLKRVIFAKVTQTLFNIRNNFSNEIVIRFRNYAR